MKKTKAWGIASLVLAIISLFLWLAPYIGLPLAILAVVFYAKQRKIEPTGIAIAGLVIGIIGIVLNGTMILIMIGVFAFMGMTNNLFGSSNVAVQPTENVNGSINQSSKNQSDQKIKSGIINIDRIQIQVANLYPTRISVTNTGDVEINPKFDFYVYDKDNNEVYSGSPLINPFYSLDPGEKKTEEISMAGCMFNEDGIYVLKIDLLDSDYNILDTQSKDFEVNYWGQFEF